MNEPELQKVVIVAANAPPGIPEQTVFESAEVTLGRWNGVGAQELSDALDGLVSPADRDYEERRTRFDWGASGPLTQEILVTFAVSALSNVTVLGVLAGIKALRRKLS